MANSSKSQIQANEALLAVKNFFKNIYLYTFQLLKEGTLPVFMVIIVLLLNVIIFSWAGYGFYLVIYLMLITVIFVSKYWLREQVSVKDKIMLYTGVICVITFVSLDLLMSFLYIINLSSTEFGIWIILVLDLLILLSLIIWFLKYRDVGNK
jgi:hypothetical protein